MEGAQDPKISIREFARRVGVADSSVHKAIKSGKIVKGLVTEGKQKYILQDVAMAEWGNSRDPTYANRSQSLSDKLPSTVAPAVQNPVPADQADTSLAAAKRAQAVLKVQQMRMDIERQKGNLVDKSQVYAALFNVGNLVKSSVLAVPDRVIDDVMAQPTRAGAYQILYNALVQALENVADSMKNPI